MLDAMQSGRLELVTSAEAIDEFRDVVQRPRLAQWIGPLDAQEMTDLLRRLPLFKPERIEAICRDPNDDYLLALARTSGADALVTRDEDLLAIGRYGQTDIIPVAEFLRRLGETGVP